MSQLDQLRARARSRLSSLLMRRGYFKGKSAPVKDSLLYETLHNVFLREIEKLEHRPKIHADLFVALCPVLGVGLERKPNALWDRREHENAEYSTRSKKQQSAHEFKEREWKETLSRLEAERLEAVGGRVWLNQKEPYDGVDEVEKNISGNIGERARTRLTIHMWGEGYMQDYPVASSVGGPASYRARELARALYEHYPVKDWIDVAPGQDWSDDYFIKVAEILKIPLTKKTDLRKVPSLQEGLAHRPPKRRYQAPKRSMAPVTQTGCDVASVEFLSTYEWRRVRMEALKKHGARCQCCGATPATGAVMNVDHIKPRRLFPQLALSVDNLQVLCHECNHGKGNWDMTDWRGDSAEMEAKLDSPAEAHKKDYLALLKKIESTK